MPEYFADLSEAKKAITIEDIMTMRSGLYCGPTPPEFNQTMKPTEDWVAFVLEQELTSTPGTVYDYSTGLTHLGSAMITETVGVSTRAYAREHLFEPLGISTPRWDGSPEGYDFGGAEMWMRPRDSARFGQLYLDNGMVGEQQILDPLLGGGIRQPVGAGMLQSTLRPLVARARVVELPLRRLLLWLGVWRAVHLRLPILGHGRRRQREVVGRSVRGRQVAGQIMNAIDDNILSAVGD